MIQCHHVDGTCVAGCEQGFLGDKCQTGKCDRKCDPNYYVLVNIVFKQWHLLKAVFAALFQFCFICITLSFFYNKENDTLTMYCSNLGKKRWKLMFYLSLIS